MIIKKTKLFVGTTASSIGAKMYRQTANENVDKHRQPSILVNERCICTACSRFIR